MVKLFGALFLLMLLGAQYSAQGQGLGRRLEINEEQYRSLMSSCVSRQKSILEQILNYSTYADESGIFGDASRSRIPSGTFWISGLDGEHKCILSEMSLQVADNISNNIYNYSTFSFRLSQKIDLRTFNQTGFRLQYPNQEFGRAFRLGDERQFIRGSADAVMERLQNAWGLAFQECPGVRSAF